MTAEFNIRMPSEADLRRYRDEACKEVMASNLPKLLAVIQAIQPAAVKATETQVMFKHVIEIDEKFYVRRWSVFGFEYWDDDGYWWTGYRRWWTGYATPELAAAAICARKPRFVGWLGAIARNALPPTK